MTIPGTDQTTPTWVLRVTATSASLDAAAFEQQRALLQSVAAFDQTTRTWSTLIGQLDPRALNILSRLFEAARRYGTNVTMEAVARPDAWRGPCFTDAEVAAALAIQADDARPLGHLPLD
ncbi:hypothetical protein ACFV3E_42070 [Streptomyces sp. NPDC059718]